MTSDTTPIDEDDDSLFAVDDETPPASPEPSTEFALAPSSRIASIVLCGGESLRMGRPKALLPFGPETLLVRVVRLAARSSRIVAVVAAHEQELPPLPDGVIVARDPAPKLGPLQGIAAGLDALPSNIDLVFVSGTDAPFLEPGWIGLLEELIGEADLAIPEVGGFLQPMAALYRRSTVREAITAQLASGRRSPSSLVGQVKSRIVRPEELAAVDPSLSTLWNLNTPDDYRAALDVAGF